MVNVGLKPGEDFPVKGVGMLRDRIVNRIFWTECIPTPLTSPSPSPRLNSDEVTQVECWGCVLYEQDT